MDKSDLEEDQLMYSFQISDDGTEFTLKLTGPDALDVNDILLIFDCVIDEITAAITAPENEVIQ